MPDNYTVVSPRSSATFDVSAGGLITLIDVDGEQVADLCFVLAEDHEEGFSGIVTAQMNGTIALTKGARLFTNHNRAAFTMVEDDVGQHDLLMGACSRASYLERYGAVDHPNCHDLLKDAFASRGVRRSVADTFNAFMNVPVAPDGSLSVQRPRSRADDRVTLRAEYDLVVAVCACPADLSPCNGFNPTAIGVLS